MPGIHDVLTQLRAGQVQRILAFGSSNTERYLAGMHWFDCLDLALRSAIGRRHRCINTGISGNTTRDLLERFEEDAALYRPQAVFITIGGNDAKPTRDLSPQMFRDNLLTLHARFAALNCAVVFQTYYAPNACPGSDTPYLERFAHYMDIVREVAAQTGADLIDHLARWEPFRQRYPAYYIQLMRDTMHVNAQGNLVLGLDIARWLDLPLGLDDPSTWSFPRQCQALMDAAAAGAEYQTEKQLKPQMNTDEHG